MQIEEFLSKIVPAQGYKVVATLAPEGWFRHYFNHTHAEAADTAAALNEEGENVYFALASYRTTDSRKGENAKLVQSFWLDLDCGPTKPYPDQIAGARALATFIRETGLPQPMVVSSGNGLHIYWPLTTPITADQWRVVAHQLKQLTELQGIQVDPNRTSDVASVLRPVGTTNPKGRKRVHLLHDVDPVDPAEFAALLGAAIELFGEVPGVPPQRKALNSDLTGSEEYPPSSAYQIADRCPQITRVRDTLGNVDEPSWYAAIGLLRFTTEGAPLIQEWSSGHPDYSEEATAAKIRQHEESGVRPTTCTGFQKAYPAGCVGCPHAGKINSPISLGFPDPKPLEEPPTGEDGEVLPDVPRGYQRTDRGLCVLVTDEKTKEQSWQVFCPYDLYPVSRLRVDGREVLRLRAKFPLDGWQLFDVELGVVLSSARDLMKTLGDAGIALKPLGVKHMPGYLIDWVTKLQKEKEAIVVYDKMGWQDDTSFVCGTRRYLPDGTDVPAALSERLLKSGADRAFVSAGSLEAWKAAAQAYNAPKMQQYQFVIGASFGAPLMRFTQQDGALIHILSEDSAQGKTTAEIAALSVYGHWRGVRLNGNDTQNAFFNRLAGYGSLPGVVDELDISDKFDPRAFVHVISQGKERGRLRADGTERNPNNTWCTLVVASSNKSIVERLTINRANPDAEIARIFEYYMKLPQGVYSKNDAEQIFGAFRDNYGHAGEIYLRWLVSNQEEAARITRKFQARFDKAMNTSPTERYWSATVGCVLAGLYIASKLNLVSWDLGLLERWTIEVVNGMRGVVHEAVRTPLDTFAMFINDNVDHIIVVDRPVDMRKKQGCQVLNAHVLRGPLKARIERSINKLWVARRSLDELAERGVNITTMKNYLADAGALTRQYVLKCLGKGTEYETVSVPCWEIDLSAAVLSGLVDLSVIQGVSHEQQAVVEDGE